MLKVEKDLAEDLLVKSELVGYLCQTIKDKKLDDSQVAKILGLESGLLGCEIDIVVKKSAYGKGLMTVTVQ